MNRSFLMLIRICLFSVCLCCAPPLFADDDNPPELEGDPGVPVDGGVTALLVSAAVYGYKKIRTHAAGEEPESPVD